MKPELKLKQKVPPKSEIAAVGDISGIISRGGPRFQKELIKHSNPDIVFKDEEKTGADYHMTQKLASRLNVLAAKVKLEWPGLKLRVTEAWDENMEHCKRSSHYEGRAADITTSDRDSKKLGRLGQLAVESGFRAPDGWTFYENSVHVHVSVSK